MSHSESIYKILGDAARVWHRGIRSRWQSMLRSLNRLLGFRLSDRHFYKWLRTKDRGELDRYLDLTERKPND